VHTTHSTSVAVSPDARRSRRKVTFRQNAETAFFMGVQMSSCLPAVMVAGLLYARIRNSAAHGWKPCGGAVDRSVARDVHRPDGENVGSPGQSESTSNKNS
jgi:hypothetical protein